MSEHNRKARRRGTDAAHGRRPLTPRRRSALALLALLCLTAAGLKAARVGTAQNGTVNEPPAAPHAIVAFSERDFISAEGYDPADGPVTVEVIRRGQVVSQAHVTPDLEGLLEVNHPGGGCWEGVTPDLRPGDVVRTTTRSGLRDQTTVANVTASVPVQVDATTIVIRGTAQDASGNPLPLDLIEQRLINGDRFSNGRRSLRAPGAGTLDYDAPGSVNWTAT